MEDWINLDPLHLTDFYFSPILSIKQENKSLIKCKCNRKAFGERNPKLGIASVTLPGDHKNPSANHVKAMIIISLLLELVDCLRLTPYQRFCSKWNPKAFLFLSAPFSEPPSNPIGFQSNTGHAPHKPAAVALDYVFIKSVRPKRMASKDKARLSILTLQFKAFHRQTLMIRKLGWVIL